MTRQHAFVLPLLVVPLVAAGCLRIGPRIVKAPEPVPLERATPSAPVAPEPRIAAYLRLEAGASAGVTRGAKGVEGEDGMELVAGDIVEAKTGSVSLVYADAGETLLEPGSRVAILADGGAEGSIFTELRLLTGSIWTRFEKLFGADERFSVAANGVVATVRGTAFGVSVLNGDVDIQVADHEVEVTAEDEENALIDSTSTPLLADRAVRIPAGHGLRTNAKTFVMRTSAELPKLVRVLDRTEKERTGYLFALRKIAAERLRRPLRPIPIRIPSVIPQTFERRMLFLRRRALLEARLRGWVPPTRGILPVEIAPTGTSPTLQGPTSTL